MNAQITTLFLDIGGVLLTNGWDRQARLLAAQKFGLDAAEMDLSKTFEAGQGYVALSRLKSWDGLFLKGINRISLALDPLSVKADVRFQELSEENEDWVNIHNEKDSLRPTYLCRREGYRSCPPCRRPYQSGGFKSLRHYGGFVCCRRNYHDVAP